MWKGEGVEKGRQTQTLNDVKGFRISCFKCIDMPLHISLQISYFSFFEWRDKLETRKPIFAITVVVEVGSRVEISARSGFHEMPTVLV